MPKSPEDEALCRYCGMDAPFAFKRNMGGVTSRAWYCRHHLPGDWPLPPTTQNLLCKLLDECVAETNKPPAVASPGVTPFD
jgi:hypothetical protein